MEPNTISVLLDKSGQPRRHIWLECERCHDLFPKPLRFLKKSKSHYCSRQCAKNEKILSAIECPICKTMFSVQPKRLRNTQSGLLFCSRKCKDLAQSHKHNKLLNCGLTTTGIGIDYRSLAFANYDHECEICFKPFRPVLEVHHIDHDNNNHSISNLMILCSDCHGLETHGYIAIGEDRQYTIIRPEYQDVIAKMIEISRNFWK